MKMRNKTENVCRTGTMSGRPKCFFLLLFVDGDTCIKEMRSIVIDISVHQDEKGSDI